MDKPNRNTAPADSTKDNKDPDELIHEKSEEVSGGVAKHDPDEAVHEQTTPLPPSAEMDVDDLLHQPESPEPEQ